MEALSLSDRWGIQVIHQTSKSTQGVEEPRDVPCACGFCKSAGR